MEINPEIFKAYDIRGVYPSEVNEKIAYLIGRALVEHTGARKVAVGKDIRNSSDALEREFVKGLNDGGADVVKIGVATTPMLYFASWNSDADAAVVITASHNPAEYNGFKLCLKNAVPIGEGSGMEEIRDLVLKNDFKKAAKPGMTTEDRGMKDKYISYVSSFANQSPGIKKRKIVFDFANAMGILDKEIIENLDGIVQPVYLFDEYDGTFPNHEANPLKTETLQILQEKVVSEQADLGVAYDGDADRIGFVDELGAVVPMDYVIALVAKEILKKHPGGKILMDLRSSNAVGEVITEAGGVIGRCRVGHSLIKAQMRKEGAIFAGELSGHYFFEENSKAEMASLVFVMMLNLMNETGRSMSELTRELKRYFHSGEINSEVEDKEKVFRELKEKYSEGKLDELDGVRIDFDNWWFNVRASNTEPKIRLNLEAKSKELMEQKRDEVLALIRS